MTSYYQGVTSYFTHRETESLIETFKWSWRRKSWSFWRYLLISNLTSLRMNCQETLLTYIKITWNAENPNKWKTVTLRDKRLTIGIKHPWMNVFPWQEHYSAHKMLTVLNHFYSQMVIIFMNLSSYFVKLQHMSSTSFDHTNKIQHWTYYKSW